MKLSKHPHLDAEHLLHLLRLLGIRATIKPLTRVGISVESRLGYMYPGVLTYKGKAI